ncbi:hypothetical protein [Mucilaginibacter flavidus]|uniref:hypothetical protein n=1 Tax=Mucilaginibacter flavidus TaxID=2949309 RepID=UPI00209399DB|nr:hypothetical protein [Mucilaginibacter flavidus]MCO5948668.1 hypothetical protein [Mucilaginibacter flavidus]
MDIIATTLKTSHPTRILEWKHESFEKFLGSFQSDIHFELGITKPDIFNSTFHFSVKVIMTYRHQSNGEIFKAITESNFEISYHHDAPTVEFLFGLIDNATFEFAKIFDSKIQGTNLVYHKVTKPSLTNLRESLQQVIDYWDGPAKKFKESGGERLTQFKNLPVIPEFKIYNGNNVTMEQKILRKLETGQEVSIEEREMFEALGKFYDDLNTQLSVLDYKTFTPKDIQDFRNYIHYAFNSNCLITNQATITGDLFRLVVNESVTGKNETITDVKFLTYPPLEILKKKNRYNRASTCNSTLLYLTETIDTALKEIRPAENKIVTISVWAPKRTRTFTQYPIEHSEHAAKVNPQVAQGLQALKLLNDGQDPLLARYMSNYFNLLAREYSKSVADENHFEYMLSAILSDNIFEFDDNNPDFNYDCISYPSVGNSFFTRNLAVKPNIADTEFKIIRVIEFEVIKAHYGRTPVQSLNTCCISVAEIKNYRETWNIADTGQIIWE